MTETHPQVSVVVFVREIPATIEESLASLEGQECFAGIEVILADGAAVGATAALRERFPWLRHLALPGRSMPDLKAAAIRVARAPILAILDPFDAPEPGWAHEIFSALSDDAVSAVGGAVIPGGTATAANRAAYLFEYGAFNPPMPSGPTHGDLPGNNVAYRRACLAETCEDILAAEGFKKPFLHARIRERGGILVLRETMRVRHVTAHRFIPFGVRRFNYGRCFGATRWRRSPWGRRALYMGFAPLVPFILIAKHVTRALQHAENRRLLPHAGAALVGVCVFWGVGEWIGYWFGPGRSCEKVF